MDNILQRMLAVDQQADDIVQSARQEAERLQTETRRKLTEENQAFEHSLNEECEKILQDRLAVIESQRQALLQEADRRIEVQCRQLAEAAAGQISALADVLSYPTAGQEDFR